MTDTLSSVLSALPPVGLPELDEQAALLTRVDRKYVVPAADLPLLCAGLSARVLEIDGRRRFGYASTYFDTPDLASFRGAAHKRRRRFKVRTREYIDTGTAWVEVKTRGPRGSTVKQRLPLDRTPEAGPLDAAACDFVGSALLRGGVVDIDPGRWSACDCWWDVGLPEVPQSADHARAQPRRHRRHRRLPHVSPPAPGLGHARSTPAAAEPGRKGAEGTGAVGATGDRSVS